MSEIDDECIRLDKIAYHKVSGGRTDGNSKPI